MGRFLDFVGKHDVYNYWLRVKPSLNASELKVLYRLLDHQNPDTGRCDPSINRLSEDTAISTRMVRKAIKGLEEHGAIKVVSRAQGRRNKYCVVDATKTAPKKVGKQSSKTGEPGFQKAGKHSSPEKEKKKEKKKGWGSTLLDHQRASPKVRTGEEVKEQGRLKEEELEKKALQVFQSMGWAYKELLAVPSENWNEILELYRADETSLDEAVAALCEIAGGAGV